MERLQELLQRCDFGLQRGRDPMGFRRLCLQIFEFLPRPALIFGQRCIEAIICAKIPLANPHKLQFIVVCFDEAGPPDPEQQDGLSLTGWIVIPWTLSAILRCVRTLCFVNHGLPCAVSEELANHNPDNVCGLQPPTNQGQEAIGLTLSHGQLHYSIFWSWGSLIGAVSGQCWPLCDVPYI